MMRLQSNLDELCLAAIDGQLQDCEISWHKHACLGVVLAEKGYPERFNTGAKIQGLAALAQIENSKVCHAGTALLDGEIVSNGGRVLCACALGADIKEAQVNAYKLADSISWESKYCRTDIGFKALGKNG